MSHDSRLLSADLERQSCAVALVMELMEHCNYAQMTLTEEAQGRLGNASFGHEQSSQDGNQGN